ncbi:MAG: MMPL family transporter [candidate division WOR-3 bacterium]|nr:MAG: MMPL family transporter [candidate division WOR-3 bacterium]
MRERLLRSWARITASHPWRVIIGVLIVTVLAAISASQLRMDMRWSDLLPMNDPKAREFDEIITEYKSASTFLVVIRGEEQQMKQFADAIAQDILHLKQYFSRVDYKLDKEFLSNHALMLAEKEDLETFADMFKDLSLIPLLTSINDNFEEEYVGDEEALSTKEKENEAVRTLDGFHSWLKAMDTFITDPGVANSTLADSAVERFLYGDPYFISQDKRVLLMHLKTTFTAMEVDKDIASTDSVQAILARRLPDFPKVKAGVAGIIPLQKDEMEHITRDMKFSSVLALVLVMVLFMLTFRIWSTPILAGLNLMISLVIAAGGLGLALGRLNMMTSMFAVILIGLGIDYAIHIISVYGERRTIDKDAATAMEETMVRSGPGIITAALTTAAAFFALAISVTQGIKEMGIVLGIGIICAMVTTMIMLPAILIAREKFMVRMTKKPLKQPHVEFKFLGHIGSVIALRPLIFLIAAILITAFFLYQAINIKFDYNMLNLEPEGLETVALQDTIIEAFDLSPDFAMVTTASIDESYEISEKLKQMPLISMVENIADYVPPQRLQEERITEVKKIRRIVGSTGSHTMISYRNISQLTDQLERLDINIYELSQMAFIGGQDKVDAKAKSIIGDPEMPDARSFIIDLVDKIKQHPESAIRQLNRFQKYYEPNLRRRIYKMANPSPITLNDLPQHVKSQYVNERGDKYLVTIYPKEQVYNYEALTRLDKQLEAVSPKITGTPPIFLHLIRLIGRDGLIATLLTVVIVILLLWVDFRSLRFALLGVTPLITGGIWMLGIMKTFGLKLDMLNVMAIPMIVGIGIDDGVHVLHRYIFEGLKKTPVVLRSTGKAVLLTSLTTMAGFGSLMTASYRGWASFGALLVTGVGACFVTTILFIPSIIGLLTSKKLNNENGD